MIAAYVSKNGHLQPIEWPYQGTERPVWIDLLQPTREEEEELEQRLAVNIPTREEMEEIEISSRLYHTEGASYMTATLPSLADADTPVMGPVTFVLAEDYLVTIRYHEPSAFETFARRSAKMNLGCTGGDSTLVALLDAIIDRLADILERVGADIDAISRDIFQHGNGNGKSSRSGDFQRTLEEIGRKGDMISNIRDSLTTMDRLTGFLSQAIARRANPGRELRDGAKTLSRDVRSLTTHADFLSQKITFLLDATLGMINIEQNAVIKILSIAAAVFLPPTLIASIYGMNFEFMPELDWPWGYPAAVVLMVISAVLPYLFFKRRGWL